jgi:hypothetical protein
VIIYKEKDNLMHSNFTICQPLRNVCPVICHLPDHLCSLILNAATATESKIKLEFRILTLSVCDMRWLEMYVY